MTLADKLRKKTEGMDEKLGVEADGWVWFGKTLPDEVHVDRPLWNDLLALVEAVEQGNHCLAEERLATIAQRLEGEDGKVS